MKDEEKPYYLGSTNEKAAFDIPLELSVPEVFWPILGGPRSPTERVAEGYKLVTAGAVYPRGCSEFVCAALGIQYQIAKDLLGKNPTEIMVASMTRGDVIGWHEWTDTKTGIKHPAHVAIFLGDPDDNVFMDVRAPGEKPRYKNESYSPKEYIQKLYKSIRF